MLNMIPKKIMATATAAAVGLALVAAAPQQAEARGGRGLALGIGAGLLGAAVLGGYGYNSYYRPYYGSLPELLQLRLLSALASPPPLASLVMSRKW